MSQVQDLGAPDVAHGIERLRALVEVAAKAIARFAVKIQNARGESAEGALDYWRSRIASLKAADVPRIRRLNDEVSPNKKLTIQEELALDGVVKLKPRGRPAGNSGPKSLTELINDFRAWTELPIATAEERRASFKVSPLFPALLAEVYANELVRLKLEEHGKRHCQGSVSRYEHARNATAAVFGIPPSVVKNLKVKQPAEPQNLHLLAEVTSWIETGDD